MNTTETKVRKARQVYSAREKAGAVLAVWSGRRSPSRVCREAGTSWGLLNSWEKRALLGIYRALGGVELPAKRQGELGSRLEGLLTGLTPAKGTEPAGLPEGARESGNAA